MHFSHPMNSEPTDFEFIILVTGKFQHKNVEKIHNNSTMIFLRLSMETPMQCMCMGFP